MIHHLEEKNFKREVRSFPLVLVVGYATKFDWTFKSLASVDEFVFESGQYDEKLIKVCKFDMEKCPNIYRDLGGRVGAVLLFRDGKLIRGLALAEDVGDVLYLLHTYSDYSTTKKESDERIERDTIEDAAVSNGTESVSPSAEA